MGKRRIRLVILVLITMILFICHLMLNICLYFDSMNRLPYILPVGMTTRMWFWFC